MHNIKKISYSPYKLLGPPSSEGALLRVTFQDGKTGHADCHPWTSRNDCPLHQQLQKLKKKKTTPLTQQSLFFAREEALAIDENRSLFHDLTIPKSHYLHIDSRIPLDHEVKNRHTLYKIKLTPSEWRLFSLLTEQHPQAFFRIDFQNSGTLASITEFLKNTEEQQRKILFLEDPIPYTATSWQALKMQTTIPLALDKELQKGAKDPNVDILVIKPAIEKIFPIFTKKKWVITHYLDHPIGQLGAAYVAAQYYKKTPNRLLACGLLSPSSPLKEKNGELIPPSGVGWGFSEFLDQQKWEIL